ncbi:hypothetical protein GCM10020295_66150 [Streptomyces cinereospinus]
MLGAGRDLFAGGGAEVAGRARAPGIRCRRRSYPGSAPPPKVTSEREQAAAGLSGRCRIAYRTCLAERPGRVPGKAEKPSEAAGPVAVATGFARSRSSQPGGWAGS